MQRSPTVNRGDFIEESIRVEDKCWDSNSSLRRHSNPLKFDLPAEVHWPRPKVVRKVKKRSLPGQQEKKVFGHDLSDFNRSSYLTPNVRQEYHGHTGKLSQDDVRHLQRAKFRTCCDIREEYISLSFKPKKKTYMRPPRLNNAAIKRKSVWIEKQIAAGKVSRKLKNKLDKAMNEMVNSISVSQIHRLDPRSPSILNKDGRRQLNINEHGGPERFVFGRRLDDNRRMSYLPGSAQKQIYHSDKQQQHRVKKNIKRNIPQAPFDKLYQEKKKELIAAEKHLRPAQSPIVYYDCIEDSSVKTDDIIDDENEFFDLESDQGDDDQREGEFSSNSRHSKASPRSKSMWGKLRATKKFQMFRNSTLGSQSPPNEPTKIIEKEGDLVKEEKDVDEPSAPIQTESEGGISESSKKLKSMLGNGKYSGSSSNKSFLRAVIESKNVESTKHNPITTLRVPEQMHDIVLNAPDDTTLVYWGSVEKKRDSAFLKGKWAKQYAFIFSCIPPLMQDHEGLGIVFRGALILTDLDYVPQILVSIDCGSTLLQRPGSFVFSLLRSYSDLKKPNRSHIHEDWRGHPTFLYFDSLTKKKKADIILRMNSREEVKHCCGAISKILQQDATSSGY